VFVVCCVGSGLCDGLITGLEESYCVCVCVCVCVRACVCVCARLLLYSSSFSFLGRITEDDNFLEFSKCSFNFICTFCYYECNFSSVPNNFP
jgi:hypothetical protein